MIVQPGSFSILRVKFHTVPSGVIADLHTAIPDVRRISYENIFYASDGDWIESLVVASGAEFEPTSVIESLSRVELFHHQLAAGGPGDGSTHRLTIVAHEPYPFLLGVILRGKALPNRLELRDGALTGLVTVAEWADFRALADTIEAQFGQFELLSVNQVETIGAPLGSGQLDRVIRDELTEEQLTVLRTAHRLGYFEVPRRASAEDIATELDIAQSTLSERLRLAEGRLFDLVFYADAPRDQPEE
ncbi:helix-turn-helix domain-containing protein [Halobaculum halobium]|uniref:Helix-turn-helix domain-containing protein n=1 Tax=Halobaculum halobium TaxID=3032281 RepID=A0ABD5T513_9EURY|nr:helix-turn-helix domain-containing protein [Halobaculum sp. SYNS20]